MISYSYVNGSVAEIPYFDSYNTYESEVNEIIDNVSMSYFEYANAINEYNVDVEFYEAGDDKKAGAVASANSNFVDKIGKAIIEVGKKALVFINNIITKIQESLFANKSDMAKVSALCKKNPSAADDINKAFRDGNLQVADLKSLQELEKSYLELIKEARQQDADPDSIKAKWATAKKKFGDLENSDIVKGVLTIGKVAGAIATIATLKSMIQKSNDEAKYAHETLAARIGKANSDAASAAAKAEVDTKLKEHNIKAGIANAASVAAKAAVDTKTAADRIAQSHLTTNKEKFEYFKKHDGKDPDGILNGAEIRSFTKKLLAKESVFDDYEFDENGYMRESASSADINLISKLHADFSNIVAKSSNLTFSNIMKAQAIIRKALAAGAEAYNKDPNEKKSNLPERLHEKYGKKDNDEDE